MQRLLQILLLIVSLGLCAVCVVQWTREARYRGIIEDLSRKLEAENARRIEADRKVDEYAKEIERINTLRAEVEAKLLTVTEELNAMSVDSVGRGFTLANFLAERAEILGKLTALEQNVGKGTEALKQHNSAVTAQNDTIARQNDLLKKLASERDTAIEKLNTRTKEFNELVEKYNKLAKTR
jgi:hypothetical protein